MPDIPVGDTLAVIVDWLRDNWSPLFDAISTLMLWLVDVVLVALTAPAAIVVILAMAALAFWLSGWKLALFSLVGALIIQGMGLWPQTMATLAVVLVASVLAFAVGVPLGIWAARSPAANAVIRPVLDLMQTLPAFVYLIPAVFFFSVGVVPAVVATFIFAIAPGVRLTELGIRQVDQEMVEASIAFGAKPRQTLRQVQLPLAVPSIMAGLNQVIMLSLAMVVIAGMVGAGGLGSTVITALQRLDIGLGFEGGLAVVFLAIFLDRVTSSLSKQRPRLPGPRRRPKPSPPVAPVKDVQEILAVQAATPAQIMS